MGMENARIPEFDVDPMFLQRWSPRAFRPDPIPTDELYSLFEAARWAPSSYNEQPWRFVYAISQADRERFVALLNEKNRAWAGRAPVLVFLATRRHLGHTGAPNRHAAFDAGAAWMSLALQARKLGLFTHAMQGFDLERSYGVLGFDPEHYEVMCAIAIGRRGDKAHLSERLRDREAPNGRRYHTEIVFEGRFDGKE